MDRGSCNCTGDRDQNHIQEKEMQKSKVPVWGGLTNRYEKKRSEKQRIKGKIYLFECRVPKLSKDKKAFLSDQCKGIEKNNRMGKTGDLFKKIRDTKGTFQVKSIKLAAKRPIYKNKLFFYAFLMSNLKVKFKKDST